MRAVLRGSAIWSALVFVIVSASCAVAQRDDSRPIVMCSVCAYDGDMGCVRVLLDADTARVTWRGKVYFFCSEECRRYFEPDPEKYARVLE